MHPNPYATAQRETLSGRALERAVLSRVTARLVGADPKAPGGPAALAAALEENRRLWCALAADLADPANRCGDHLKAGLLSLAAFVETHTAQVLAGRAAPGILVTINRDIIDGLSAAKAADTAEAA